MLHRGSYAGWAVALAASLIVGVYAENVFAQDYRYEGIGSDVFWSPLPDDSRVDYCFGHCGKECGSSWAWCGDRHTWVRRIPGPASFSSFDNQTECRATEFVPPDWPGGYVDGEVYSFAATRYTANGSWEFEGQTHSLCIEHDEGCRSGGSCSVTDHLKALWWRITGCDAESQNWGPYNETFYRWQFTTPWPTGEACQVWVGSQSG